MIFLFAPVHHLRNAAWTSCSLQASGIKPFFLQPRMSYVAKCHHFSPSCNLLFFSFPSSFTPLSSPHCCPWFSLVLSQHEMMRSRESPPPTLLQRTHAHANTHTVKTQWITWRLDGISELSEKFGWQWVGRLLSQYLIDILLQCLRTAWEGTKNSAMATTLKAP